jgi:uncharacterized BrkB/YihY/UPF0761 family membrane protein
MEYLIGLSIAIILIGFVMTFLIGFSKENKKQNPVYVQNTKRNLITLTIIYAFLALFLVSLIILFL